jgi:hypothetical protein
MRNVCKSEIMNCQLCIVQPSPTSFLLPRHLPQKPRTHPSHTLLFPVSPQSEEPRDLVRVHKKLETGDLVQREKSVSSGRLGDISEWQQIPNFHFHFQGPPLLHSTRRRGRRRSGIGDGDRAQGIAILPGFKLIADKGDPQPYLRLTDFQVAQPAVGLETYVSSPLFEGGSHVSRICN